MCNEVKPTIFYAMKHMFLIFIDCKKTSIK